ncbi:MAG: BatA and WFA domain-containing protein [Planctomycetota bacterium]
MILENPVGLWALAAIIAVLILHRLRQRPERKEVSSLLIWKRIEQLLTAAPVRNKSRLYLILMLQILAVIGLALALAKPVWRTTQPEPLHLVFLIDNSASMRVVYHNNWKITTRLDLMKEKIKEVITRSPTNTTVSLYQTPPLKAFVDLKSNAVFTIINDLESAKIPSDVESLVSMAHGVKGELYFCSDKLPPDDLINKLPKKPHLILVGKPSSNIAIIHASVTSTPNKEDYYDSFVTIKNYSSNAADNIFIDLTNKDGVNFGHQEVSLGAGEKRDLFFKNIHLPEKASIEIILNNKDDMMIDNWVVLLPPQPCKINMSGKDIQALAKALKAMPPVSLNSQSESGDISIFNETLPLTLPAKAIVINCAPETNAFWDYEGVITNPMITSIDTSSPILKYCDLDVFNNIPYSRKLLPKEKEYVRPIITASGTSGDECVLIGEWRKGDRHLVFLNFPLEWRNQTQTADWTLTPSFPIFWTNLINYLHPLSRDYTIGEGLCNEEESDNNGITVLDTSIPAQNERPQMETRRVELGAWTILSAVILLLLSWILARR